MVFRGIADAFPEATIKEKGIVQNDRPHPFHQYALISVLRAVTPDGRIIVLTRLREPVNFSNRSVTCYKKSSNEAFEVPIRQPVSDEDVGDVILIALGSKPTKEGYYIGVCEGILLSASSSDEDNPSPISGKLKIFFLLSFQYYGSDEELQKFSNSAGLFLRCCDLLLQPVSWESIVLNTTE